MSVTVQADPVAEALAGVPDEQLLVNVFREGNSCVVHLTGELDLASRNQLFVASTAGSHPDMVIDLAGVTFMDCCGYGSLVASRLVIEGQGRTLTMRGQAGQPARFFRMIAPFEGTDSSNE